MSTPSPYAAITRAQRPPNRRATGRKKVSKGEEQAIAVLGLSGEFTQAELAAKFDRSRDFVKKCIERARTLDPEEALIMRRAMPDEYLKAAFMANQRTIEAIAADEPGEATKWAFASKLATESNRWADKIGDGTGATMLEFIKALNESGGGSVTVTVNGTGTEPPAGPVLDVEASRVD